MVLLVWNKFEFDFTMCVRLRKLRCSMIHCHAHARAREVTCADVIFSNRCHFLQECHQPVVGMCMLKARLKLQVISRLCRLTPSCQKVVVKIMIPFRVP